MQKCKCDCLQQVTLTKDQISAGGSTKVVNPLASQHPTECTPPGRGETSMSIPVVYDPTGLLLGSDVLNRDAY